MPLELSSPIAELHGVGEKTESRLHVLRIRTIEDLLYYAPRQYEDRSSVTAINQVEENSTCTVKGTVIKLRQHAARRRRMTITEAIIQDDTGEIHAIWFNQPYVKEQLEKSGAFLFSGKVKTHKNGLQLQNPIFEPEREQQTHVGRIVPEYPLTFGITQKQVRYFVKQALELAPEEDPLPKEMRTTHNLPTLKWALQKLHFPESLEEAREAQERLAFDRLLLTQLYAADQRKLRQLEKAPEITFSEKDIAEFTKNLPFTLTNAQKKAAWDVFQDIAKPHPMHRLIVGDVGAGKTVVAAMAGYQASLGGFQTALMAPTEVLANQHFQSLQKIFAKTDVTIELLTRDTSKQYKKKAVTADIVVGTHAIIQDSVQFRRLGLAIVDEQHRFGVDQRRKMKEIAHASGSTPHFLSMTATPIPRSLALTLYGDLDLSYIDELPPGRKPIKTWIVPKQKRDGAYTFLEERMNEGEFVFVICPLIEDSEFAQENNLPSVEQVYEHMQKRFPKHKIVVLHGKMSSEEKQTIMKEVAEGNHDMMVATSVIEVGVDVPHATVMMIEGADRFGLAQLHQFRGRVGRSSKQSYCLLFTNSRSQTSRERLHAMETETDGLKLAEKDLELRGSGDAYGTQQTGFSEAVNIAIHYPELVEKTRNAAQDLLQEGLEHTPEIKKRYQAFADSVHME